MTRSYSRAVISSRSPRSTVRRTEPARARRHLVRQVRSSWTARSSPSLCRRCAICRVRRIRPRVVSCSKGAASRTSSSRRAFVRWSPRTRARVESVAIARAGQCHCVSRALAGRAVDPAGLHHRGARRPGRARARRCHVARAWRPRAPPRGSFGARGPARSVVRARAPPAIFTDPEILKLTILELARSWPRHIFTPTAVHRGDLIASCPEPAPP
jgi:hypothetical protein